MGTKESFVVTGGSHGIGRVIAEFLADRGPVVVVDPAPGTVTDGIALVRGDAGDPGTMQRAADLAESRGHLSGWVNNAAVFRDATLSAATAAEVSSLITINLNFALVGCHTAVNHFLARARPGSIVNISSHQAQRPVRGALPYATAKAAIEGLTRAAAVDHGPQGIRVNALALGSITTPRYERYRAEHPEVDEQMALLHPLGHVGEPQDVAEAVGFLLSKASRFITGTVLPVDGGRAAQGPDPEAN